MKTLIALLAAGMALLAAAPAAADNGNATVISGIGVATITPEPVVTARSYGGLASSYLFYQYDLTGFALQTQPGNMNPILVPLLLTFAGSTSGSDTGFYNATVQISVGNYGTSFHCGDDDTSGCGVFSATNQGFNYAAFTDIAPDTILTGTVFMSAYATNEHNFGFASAWVDPVISFDPAFLLAHPGATVSYGAVTPRMDSSATPEAASWAMLVTGFGATGAMMRRRRTGSALSA